MHLEGPNVRNDIGVIAVSLVDMLGARQLEGVA
jgi:hypothetical protein